MCFEDPAHLDRSDASRLAGMMMVDKAEDEPASPQWFPYPVVKEVR